MSAPAIAERRTAQPDSSQERFERTVYRSVALRLAALTALLLILSQSV